MLVNFVQAGGVNWVFSTFSRNLSARIGCDSLVTPIPVQDADVYVTLCPEYALGLTCDQATRAWTMVHHFEEADPTRTVEARRKIFDALHGVVCLSKPPKRQLDAAGIRCSLIPQGVDLDAFRPGLVVKHGGEIRVGVCGRNHSTGRKGPARIAAIAREIAGASMRPVEIVFCGHEWDAMLAEINKHAPRVRASLWLGTGKYDTYKDYYNSLDALLVASDIEGGPFPALEALACGVPVVSTPVGHMPDLVVPGSRNVILYDFADARGAALALLDLANKPPDRAMCRASVAHRSWDLVAAQWRALLGVKGDKQ